MRIRSKKYKSKYHFEPTLGVKTDFETLLQRFSSAGTVRYEKFAECWRDLNMACYCAGRQSKREAREFVEQCLLIAVQFWLPPSSFLVRAGALYLLYGLYYFQLVVPKVKIRITPEQWKEIQEFQTEAREQQHLDLDYVFQKMMLEKAFMFVATPDEVYLRQKSVDDTRMIPDSLKEETSSVEEVFSGSVLNQLALVHNQYQNMKVALTGDDDTSLNIVHTDLLSSINKTLQIHKERQSHASLKSQVYKNKTLQEMTQEDEFSSTDESVSMQKLLKLKAFESGIQLKRKRRKGFKKLVPDEENDLEVLEISEESGTEKTTSEYSRGGLFEKDEQEDAPVVLPMVHEVYCMPDLDSIVPKPPSKPSKLESTSEEDTDNLASSKTPNKKGGKRKLSEQPDTHTETLNEEEPEIASKKSKQGASKKSKTVKSETFENKSRLGKPNVKVEYTRSETQKEDAVEKKRPTAQELLQIKLHKRRKDARLGGKASGKKATGKKASGGKVVKKSNKGKRKN